VGGSKRLGEQNKRDGAKGKPPRAKDRRAGGETGKSSGKSARLSGSNVGRVLRTAYDDALREPVPDDFLDLLGKLD
jgi:hypothetical protein